MNTMTMKEYWGMPWEIAKKLEDGSVLLKRNDYRLEYNDGYGFNVFVIFNTSRTGGWYKVDPEKNLILYFEREALGRMDTVFRLDSDPRLELMQSESVQVRLRLLADIKSHIEQIGPCGCDDCAGKNTWMAEALNRICNIQAMKYPVPELSYVIENTYDAMQLRDGPEDRWVNDYMRRIEQLPKLSF